MHGLQGPDVLSVLMGARGDQNGCADNADVWRDDCPISKVAPEEAGEAAELRLRLNKGQGLQPS